MTIIISRKYMSVLFTEWLSNFCFNISTYFHLCNAFHVQITYPKLVINPNSKPCKADKNYLHFTD